MNSSNSPSQTVICQHSNYTLVLYIVIIVLNIVRTPVFNIKFQKDVINMTIIMTNSICV